MSSSTPHDAHPAHAHQEDQIVLRPVVIAGVALLIFVTLTGLAMFGLFNAMQREEARLSPPANPLAAAEGPRKPPEPRLQTHPLKDLDELHKAENELLTSYGWVDKSAGTVRVPIDRAMDILAAKSGGTGAAQP